MQRVYEGKYKLTNYIDRVDKILSMVKYDKVCNNVVKDNIRHVNKDNYLL